MVKNSEEKMIREQIFQRLDNILQGYVVFVLKWKMFLWTRGIKSTFQSYAHKLISLQYSVF